MIFNIPRDLNLLAPTIVPDLIRVGGTGDGGYVVSESSITSADCLISFGLCDDWTFEHDFLVLHPNAKIHVYDHTVSQRLFYRTFRKKLYRFLLGRFNELPELKRNWNIYKGYQHFFRGEVRHFRNRVHNKCDLPDDANIDLIMSRVVSNKIFLKMDIEGAECAALHGAKNILRDLKPKLAISAYHKEADLWELPQLIKSLNPDYKLYFSHHSPISWESVVYAA